MKLNKQFFIEKILPILITSLCSALISILGNIISAYTGNHTIQTNPETVGVIGGALKSIQHIKNA